MPVSEAQKRATAKYEKEKYDKILTRFPKGTKEKIINTGTESINRFIIEAVREKLERDSGMELSAGPIRQEKAELHTDGEMTKTQIEQYADRIARGEIDFYFLDQIRIKNEIGEENFKQVYEAVCRKTAHSS